MASPSITRTAFFFLISLFSNPILIISSGTLHTTFNPNLFDSQIVLYGDAAYVEIGSEIRLTKPSISSSGMLMYDKPLRFLGPNPRNGVSFSAHFTFSISPEKGDGVMFLIAPKDLKLKFPGKDKFGLTGGERFLGVEFNGNQIGIGVNDFVPSSIVNVSSGIDLVLNSGKKFQSWIDYDATSKRIEVRLSEFGTARPYNPLLSYGVDLVKMWKDEEVFVGISASNGNSMQSSSVYSCRFVVRNVPSSLHSQPLDPASFKKTDGRVQPEEGYEQKSRFHPLSVLAGVIFTTGCGALVAFMVLFLWVVFVDRHKVLGEPAFKYENIDVVVIENDIDVVKN
ncbi:unnamed protein product [Rhodiola kirilowii]